MPSQHRVATFLRLITVVSLLLSSAPSQLYVQAAPSSGIASHAEHASVAAAAVPTTSDAPLAMSTFTSPLPTPAPQTGSGLPGPALSTSEPTLALAARAEPEGAAPGEVVTFTLVLSNASDAIVKGLVVSATVPDGLEWILSQPGWTFDAEAKRARANVGDLAPSAGMTLTLPLQVAEPVDTLATLMVEAICDGATCASGRASVYVAYPTRTTIGPGGGTLVSSDNRVRVEFPVGAVNQSVEVRYRPTRVKVLSPQVHGQAMAFQFDLDALASDRAVTHFAQPLTLTVSLNGLIDLNNLPEGMYTFLAYQTPEGAWQHLDPPYYVNRQAGTISARVDHFTGYGAGVTDPSVWSQAYNPPHANLFGGAASFEIPIEVPAGRNGLQPKLALSYNSRRMDGRDGGTYSRLGPLPDGWSLSVMDIEREKWWWCDWYTDGSNGPCTTDVFSLIMNGATYELYGSPGQKSGRYYAKDAPELYIERINDCSNDGDCFDGDGGAPNTTGEYWIVRLPNGTEVRFGYAANAELLTTGICPFNQWGWGSSDCRGPYNPNNPYFGRLDANDPATAVRRWQADMMTDRVGITMTFTYAEENDGNPGNARSTLRAISYNGGLTRIALAGPGGLEPKINGIYITNTNNLGNLVTVRWYELGWGTTSQTFPGSCDMDPSNLPILSSVQQVSGDNSQRLPLQTFGYTKFQSGPNEDGCNIYMPRLTTVNNGYGAQTTITYEDSGDRETGYSWRVQRITNTGGVSGSLAMVSTYAYGTPCYDRWVTDDYGYTWHTGPCTSRAAALNGKDVKGPLVGHSVVTQTQVSPSGETLAKSVHAFHTDFDWKLGREWKAQQLDPSSGAVMQRQDTQWTSTSLGGGVTTFTYASAVTSTLDNQVSWTAYEYDPAGQGRAQYGNLAAKVEYADGGTTPYRETLWGYYPLTTTGWIVNKPAFENVYRWAGGGWAAEPDTATWYSYDRHEEFNMAPTLGQLTAERKWAGWMNAEHTDHNLVDTVYTYDGWGNRAAETTYSDYGHFATYASSSPHTTTVAYDSRYHLYAVQITNTLGLSTQTGYDLALGVPLTVTDANGAVTQYRYDSFGRLKKIVRPGDSLSYPTEEYRYFDGGDQIPTDRWPLLIDHLTRAAANRDWCTPGALASNERMFYDGLGRLVEHQSAGANWTCNGGGQEIVQYTGYGALGQVVTTSVPYTVAQWTYATTPDGKIVTPYRDPDLTQPRTTTQSDALGRVTLVTAPDGTQTRSGYLGWTTVITDANSHRKDSIADALGRLIAVKEYSGTGVYTTTYAYDTLNHLRVVTDALNNTTVITYNVLSQKVAMRDPDMGAWRYSYDLAGNLITQTDAKGQAINFGYDALNRMTSKNTGASYGYDAYNGTSQFGRGRRTVMTDTTGITNWAYDLRGRVVTETKAITGAGTFTTSYRYDPMDRVITMTYPTNEVITQTYNIAAPRSVAQVRSATHNVAYASGLTYNPLGQLTQMRLGNNLLITNTYDLLSFRLKRLQAGSLLDLNYRYDAVGNVKAITDTTNSGQVQTFGYDALDRLLSAGTTSVGNGRYNESYGYNAIGNITARISGTLTTTYGYSDTLHKHAATWLSNGATFQYDLNGNMTRRVELSGTQQMTYTQGWDTENRLSVVTNTVTGLVTRFYYDGDGKRVKKTEGVTSTVYVGAIYEKNVTTGVTTTYYHAGSQRVAMRQGGVLYYLHGDHLGSTSLVTSITGTLVARQLYGPYGAPRWSSGTLPTDYRYTGQRADTYIKLIEMGARWYDSDLGRWISPDSIVPQPGNPQTLNRFAYVNNNPLKFVDPTGHFVQCSAADNAQGYICPDDGYSIDNPEPGSVSDNAAERDARNAPYANNLADWSKRGWITGREALYNLMGRAYSMIPRNTANLGTVFANDVSRAILGKDGAGVLWNCRTGCTSERFSSTGFDNDYKDGYDQLFHFWAFVAEAANGNSTVARLGNTYHEFWDPTDPGGNSWADWRLSMIGINMGEMLRGGADVRLMADLVIDHAISSPWPGTQDAGYRFLYQVHGANPGNWPGPLAGQGLAFIIDKMARAGVWGR